MRLIDADALMKVIREHDYPLRSHFNSTDNGMFTIGVQQAVDDAPTIDAVPVARCGEWILVGTNEHDYETSVEEKCSLCGRYVYRYDTQPQDNFCPNCGAKMDKEASDAQTSKVV